jgi:hypothetical protein
MEYYLKALLFIATCAVLGLAITGLLVLTGVAKADDHLEQVLPESPMYTELTLSENFSAALFSCHVGVKSIRIIDSSYKELHGRKALMILGDRNYDGSPDMAMYFDVDEHDEPGTFPHYYVYDTEYNGMPDIAYRDVNGNGVCQEMEQVPVNYIVQGGSQGGKES